MVISNKELVGKLSELEPIVKSEARLCPNFVGLQAVDDLEQIGRLELLEVLTKRGCDFPPEYYRAAVRYAMQQAATTKYNKKRLLGGVGKPNSFDDEDWLAGASIASEKCEDGVRAQYVKEIVLRLKRQTHRRPVAIAKSRFLNLVTVIIRDVYNYSREQARAVVTFEWLKEHGLEQTCSLHFDNNISQLLDCVFVKDDAEGARENYRQTSVAIAEAVREFKGGKEYGYMKHLLATPDPKAAVKAFLYDLITKVVGYSPQQAVERIDYGWFVANRLDRILWTFYRNSPYAALIDVFGDEIDNIYAIAKLPQRFWQGEDGKRRADQALAWFVKRKKIVEKAQCREIGGRDFIEMGLGTMLQMFFRDSPRLAMQTIFPDIKPWDAKRAPAGSYDTEAQCLEAVDCFLLATLGAYIQTLSAEEVYRLGIRAKVSKASLEEFGLRGLLAKYSNQPYKLFATLYPDQIMPWSIQRKNQFDALSPQAYTRNALRWLFEDYLLLKPEELPGILSCALLWQVGFSGLMSNPQVGLNSSTFAAAELVYPGRFEPKDFSRRRGRDGKLSYDLVEESLDMRKWRKKK